jgi:hypothetical protein
MAPKKATKTTKRMKKSKKLEPTKPLSLNYTQIKYQY